MCGIAGVFELDGREADVALATRMGTRLAHRGPDDAGVVADGPVALAHRRLSIIDLSVAGRQPMWTEDRSAAIVYNGECYNYRALRKELEARGSRFRSTSDTEVVLRLYQEEGERALERLEGMFALAIWDRARARLVLARDRLGIKPLFFARYGNRFVFASELKALLADPALPREIDLEALASYLHLLSIPDPSSIFRCVRKLLPGHWMAVTAGGMATHRYWQLPVAIDEGMSFETACSGFAERFSDAVSSHTVADVPVGAFLSGGVDSSAIVSLARTASPHPIETFSITFPGLEEFDESGYAQRVAEHCGAVHREFHLTPDLIWELPGIVWHSDEPFAVSSAFALHSLAKLARKHVKVVLSGDGGDEVFAGYVWRHADFPELPQAAPVRGALRALERLPWLPRRLARRVRHVASRDHRYVDSFTIFQDSQLSGLLTEGVGEAVALAWRENPVQRALEEAPTSEQLARKLFADIHTTLVSEMLTKADRMTMAHGLEARVPFLDHRLVEWAFTVPGRHKLAAGEGKRLVKRAMEPHLPREILYRPKQGFNVPLKHWMRKELREYVCDVLCPSRIAKRGWFRSEAVSELLGRHFSGQEDASNRIYVLLMLELWQVAFLDGDGSAPVHG